ncbi:uncharacterized protein LOC117435671 [Acipenser ruthenus]|uniref:uncharacterized protein LOC117435671 n=1 Tax=Acipenser ruthenus TaxID=7906 RepID=UPI002740ACAE|nr:uncharacterized protein LOC117435671 [Acipenser ruthenus]
MPRREENPSLDIQDLVKGFQQTKVTAQQQKAETLQVEAGSKQENPSQDDGGEVWTLYCLADLGAQGNMMQAQQQFVPEQPFYPMYQGTSPVQGIFPGGGFIPIQTLTPSQMFCPNRADVLTHRRPSTSQFVLVNSPSKEKNMNILASPGKMPNAPSQRPSTPRFLSFSIPTNGDQPQVWGSGQLPFQAQRKQLRLIKQRTKGPTQFLSRSGNLSFKKQGLLTCLVDYDLVDVHFTLVLANKLILRKLNDKIM